MYITNRNSTKEDLSKAYSRQQNVFKDMRGNQNLSSYLEDHVKFKKIVMYTKECLYIFVTIVFIFCSCCVKKKLTTR